VEHLCPGGSAFAHTDGRTVDGRFDAEAFGSDADKDIDNTNAATEVIVVNEEVERLHVAFVQDSDTTAGTNWRTRTAATDLIDCGS